MLGARRRAQVRPSWRWKAGYRGSLGVSVVAARARLAGARRAVVSVRLRSRDRDACSGATVRQRFAGNVIVAPRGDSWIIVKFQMRKTGGGRPRLSKAACPAPDRGGGGGAAAAMEAVAEAAGSMEAARPATAHVSRQDLMWIAEAAPATVHAISTGR